MENPTKAVRTVESIRQHIERLAEFATGRPGGRSGTYELVLGDLPHLVVYRLLSAAPHDETIEIVTVRHMARRPLG